LTRKDILNEARAITKLCVAKEACHLVQVMAHGWLQESSDYYYIDMELCDMTLAEHIDSVDSPVVYWQKTQHTPENLKAIRRLIENVVFITESITLGLRYIHSHGEVHRDIKPSNGISERPIPFSSF
jgi:serine/threonine protein kinase